VVDQLEERARMASDLLTVSAAIETYDRHLVENSYRWGKAGMWGSDNAIYPSETV